MSSFCSAKATHIFSAKNIRILYIESAKTVNEMILYELVKLMTQLQRLLTFFSKKIQHICVSLEVNFNESFTNDVVNFEQLGPDVYSRGQCYAIFCKQTRARFGYFNSFSSAD